MNFSYFDVVARLFRVNRAAPAIGAPVYVSKVEQDRLQRSSANASIKASDTQNSPPFYTRTPGEREHQRLKYNCVVYHRRADPYHRGGQSM